MPKEETIGVEGTIVERMRNSRFRVEITWGHRVLAYVAGQIRFQLQHSSSETGSGFRLFHTI